jgi:hypothetical protein
MVSTLRRGNLFLAKTAPIKGTDVVLYVPTPERGNELFYLAFGLILSIEQVVEFIMFYNDLVTVTK